MKFVLNGGLIIGTCDGANVGHILSVCPQCITNTPNLRSKSPAKSATTTSSSLATSPKRSKTYAMPTPMARTLSTRRCLASFPRLSAAPLARPRISHRSLRLCATMATFTSSRMILPVTSTRRRSLTRSTPISQGGSASASQAWRAWASLAVIDASMSTPRRFGTLSRSRSSKRAFLLKRCRPGGDWVCW